MPLCRRLFVSAPSAPSQTLGDTEAAPPAGCKAGGTAGPPPPAQTGQGAAASGHRAEGVEGPEAAEVSGSTDLVSLLTALCRAAKACKGAWASLRTAFGPRGTAEGLAGQGVRPSPVRALPQPLRGWGGVMAGPQLCSLTPRTAAAVGP